MIQEIEVLMENYLIWLKERTIIRKVGNCVEITIPYLDRHNDYFQIYAKPDDYGFVLTDDGYVLNDLELSGCRMDSPKRQELLEMTLNGFGIQNNNNILEVKTTHEDFSLVKHNLIQAMLAVNDFYCLASYTVTSLFHDDIASWLNHSDIRHTPNIQITGKSGYTHRFDFAIPKSEKHPERLLRAINKPSRDSTESIAFSSIDTKEERSYGARVYALLNDSENSVSENIMEAMRNYDVHPVLWSKRDETKEELAA